MRMVQANRIFLWLRKSKNDTVCDALRLPIFFYLSNLCHRSCRSFADLSLGFRQIVAVITCELFLGIVAAEALLLEKVAYSKASDRHPSYDVQHLRIFLHVVIGWIPRFVCVVKKVCHVVGAYLAIGPRSEPGCGIIKTATMIAIVVIVQQLIQLVTVARQRLNLSRCPNI
jgi:hypothetical protein